MFEARSGEVEFLDQPNCDPALAATDYRLMEVVNRRLGGAQVVQRFFESLPAGRAGAAPLRILDIGSGSCDIPLAISRWARGRGMAMEFTCLEKDGPAATAARATLARAGDPAVRLLLDDAFTHQPDTPYDWAVASMCFHHFTDRQILDLLLRLRRFVREGVLINDLRRSVLAAAGVSLLTAFSRPGVRHDAVVSIRRGFKVDELRTLLGLIDGADVTVVPARWFRISASVRFNVETKMARD